MRQRILILLMLLPLLSFSSTAFAVWDVSFESKTVDANDVDVTVDITASWDIPLTGLTVPVVVRQTSGGAFWTGALPYDTNGNGFVKPFQYNVSWFWTPISFSTVIEEFRPGVPGAPCETVGDVGYDGAAPDHFVLNALGSMSVPAQPTGWTFMTFTFDVNSGPGTFEFDTACFSSALFAVFMIDNVFPPVNHGPAGTGEATFTKGVITIPGGVENNPPEFTACPSGAYEIGAPMDLAIVATDDGQPDPPAALTLTAAGVPGFLTFTDDGGGNATLAGTPGCGDVGLHTITITASDDDLTADCVMEITINPDGVDPVITCPANFTVANDPGECYATLSYVGNEATATDNCSSPGNITFTWAPAPGTQLAVGSITTVTATATDEAGNESQCTFEVTVVDDEDPVITCGGSFAFGSDPGQCDAVVDLTDHTTATDNCPGVVVSYDPASGSTFPNGTTQVTATATDAAGNTATCTFDVTIYDSEDPAPNFPPEVVVDVDPGQCYATVDFNFSAADNCPGEITFVYDPASGSQFGEGTTTQVTMTTTDAAGNSVYNNFDVTVNPVPVQLAAAPTSITFNWLIGDPYPADQMVDITNEGCGEVAFTMWDGDPPWLSVSQTGSTTPATLTLSLKDLDLLAPGVYTTDIEISEDIGPTAKAIEPLLVAITLNVVGEDNAAPQVTCPDDATIDVGQAVSLDVSAIDPNGDAITLSAEDAGGEPLPPHVTFTDNGDGTGTFAFTAQCGDIGAHTVRFIASDGLLADSCTTDLTIEDNTPPELTCPANMSVGTDDGECYATVQYSATATDNCSDPGDIVITYDPPSGSQFSQGSPTTVTVTATDEGNNQGTCTFTILVEDNEDPVAICPTDMTVEDDGGGSGANVDFQIDATDNCPGVTVDSDPASGSFFPTGTTQVTVTATDAAGNTNTCDFNVTVNPPGEPIIVSVDPNNADQGESLTVHITGLNTCFEQGSSTVTMVELTQGGTTINGTGVIVYSPTELDVDFSIPGAAPLGLYDVAVGVTGGCGVVTLEDGFTVNSGQLPDPPELVLPEEGAVMDNGCMATHEAIIWDFVWSKVPGATKYHLMVEGPMPLTEPGSLAKTGIPAFSDLADQVLNPELAASLVQYVWVDEMEIPDTLYQYVCDQYEWFVRWCSVYMFQYLDGWTWKVRAYVNGNWTEWSAMRNFELEPALTDCEPAPDTCHLHATWEHGFKTSDIDFFLVEPDRIYIIGSEVFHDGTNRDYDWAAYYDRTSGFDPSNPFIGHWECDDPETPGIHHFDIEDDGACLSTHVYATCGGGFCDWGAVCATWVNCPLCSICGEVVDESGLPIAEATVELWSEYPVGAPIVTATTDMSGAFCFDDLDQGVPYDVRVWKNGYCTSLMEGVLCDAGALLEFILTSIPEPAVTPYVTDYWSVNATLYGDPLMPGDVITAYDPDGVMCGVAYVEAPGEYVIHVYGDEPATSPGQDEGAEDGDVITFMLNCACPLDAANLWENHRSFEEDLAFECVWEMEIPLCGTWTLISYNVLVEPQDLDNVLNSIAGQYERAISSICEGDIGAVTWDANRPPELNDLTHMDNNHGYWLYAPGADLLTISGLPIDPATPINLCDEWNVISYLPNSPDELTHAFESIADDYEYVMGFDCAVGAMTFDPKRPVELNDLTCLYPGYGYWVKMLAAGTLTYPTSGYECVETTVLPKPTNLTNQLTPTPWSCDFWSMGGSDGPAAGSIVTVRDEDGIICGQSVVMADGKFLLHVYGDDPNTPADEGATAGSILSFEIDDVPCQITGGDVWIERGSGEITLTRPGSGAPTPTAYTLNQNYPNPFNAQTAISFTLPTASSWSISIYDITGRKVDQMVGQSDAGLVTVNWNAGDAPSGIYFYRLAAGKFTQARKMTLMK
ncbi:HYR domain-containing protein [Candidatus Zixiibacteriota bacterium]